MVPACASAFLVGVLLGAIVALVAGAWWLVHGWSGD